jgi:hypothetical protein
MADSDTTTMDETMAEEITPEQAATEREIAEAGKRYREQLANLHARDGREDVAPEENDENTLTPEELEVLWAAEDEIRHGIAAYLRVAEALHTIQTQRLYREDYRTFGEYCRDKWNLTDRHARNMANAWEIATDLDPDPLANAEQLPKNERQARELKSVDRERRAEVWELAVGHAGGIQHVCAHDVKWAREELIDKPAAAEAAEAARLEALNNPTAVVEAEPVPLATEVTVTESDPINHAHRIINKHGAAYAEALAVEVLSIIQQKIDALEARNA